jgi:lytic murein transglycosylase
MRLPTLSRHRILPAVAALALVVGCLTTSARALQCSDNGAAFDTWLTSLKAEAAKQGISATAINSGLAGVSYDPTVIRFDRSQRSFKLSYEQFYARRVSSSLLNRGRSLMQTHASTLARMEKQFGVPKEIVIAIWGLETSYGADSSGKFSILRSLATLSYDCRRSAFFTGHLFDALRIIQRGDMSPSDMRGGWAGEIGQTQFLPTPYVKYAVDFDGDGRRDLVRSVPDILASTANFLKGHGWRVGQGWEPGSANYGVLAEWNKADVYQRTIAAMANKLKGG